MGYSALVKAGSLTWEDSITSRGHKHQNIGPLASQWLELIPVSFWHKTTWTLCHWKQMKSPQTLSTTPSYQQPYNTTSIQRFQNLFARATDKLLVLFAKIPKILTWKIIIALSYLHWPICKIWPPKQLSLQINVHCHTDPELAKIKHSKHF